MDYEKEIPFGAFDSELMHQEINIPEGFEATIEGNKIILTKTESEDGKNKRISKEITQFLKQNNGWNREWLTWLEKQGKPIDEEKVLIGARRDVALSIMNFLDRNTLGMCLSNMECKDLEDAVVDSDWSKVYDYMKKKLEKQGERNPANKVAPFDEFEGLTDFERTLADICIGWIGEELGWKQYIKDNADVLLKIAVEKFNSVQDVPFEQKPTWSEEDERMIDNIIFELEENQENISGVGYKIDWLKSLKDKYTWKPNLAQLNALSIVSKGNAPDDIESIVSLYNDLKKLKGE